MDEPTTNSRGFLSFDPVEGTCGDTIRTYECSSGERHCIWIDVKSPNIGSGPGEATAHLPVEEARRLAEQILYLCDQG